MKKISMAIATLLFILSLCPKVKASIIWSDGFESGDFSAWTSINGKWDTSGGDTYSGSKRAQVEGLYSLDGDVLLLSRSLAGYRGVKLEYWYRVYIGLENNDYVFIEWTPNGADWLELTIYNDIASSVDWQEAKFLLPSSATDNPLFQFRLRSALNNASDRMYFDDFTLLGEPIPEPASALIFFSCFFYPLVRKKH